VLPIRTVAIAAALVVSTGAGSYAVMSARSPQPAGSKAVVTAAAVAGSAVAGSSPTAAGTPAAPRPSRAVRPAADAKKKASTPAKKPSGTSSAGASAAGASTAGASTAAAGTAASRPVKCTTTVSTAAKLVAAVARLRAGRTVCLNPGTYRLSARLVLGAAQSGSASAPAVLAAGKGPGTVTIDGNGNEEAVYIAGARHVVVTGLRITGGAYHGVKIDYPSSDVVLRRLTIVDNFRAADAGGQYSGVKGCCLVRRVTIEDSNVYYSRPAPASTNHQGIDCNGCKSWVVRRNRVHGIRAAQGGAGGTGIQFKSGSADTVIDSNIIYGNFIGITYGGFGNPRLYGHETYEHVRGIVRNNIVYNHRDAGISVINTRDGRVYNNTLFGNGFTPDVRVASRNLRYQNNILDRPLNLRDGTTAFARNNYVLRSPTSGVLFVNAAARNFRPRSTARALIDRGADLGAAVPTDARGRARRAGHYDIGALER
jgi:parallel beta-helix repeat protein